MIVEMYALEFEYRDLVPGQASTWVEICNAATPELCEARLPLFERAAVNQAKRPRCMKKVKNPLAHRVTGPHCYYADFDALGVFLERCK